MISHLGLAYLGSLGDCDYPTEADVRLDVMYGYGARTGALVVTPSTQMPVAVASYNLLIDKLKDVITTSLRMYVAANGLSISASMGKYTNMYEDQILGVARQYPNSLKKIPFVVVSTVGGDESITGFGKNRLKVDSSIMIESAAGPFDLSLGTREYVNVVVNGMESYTFDIWPSLCPTPLTHVTMDIIKAIMDQQLPNGWWSRVIDNKLQLYSYDQRTVEVVATSSVLGFTVGNYTPADHRLVTGIGEKLSLVVDIGAESEFTRAQIQDLITLWVQQTRMGDFRFKDTAEEIEAWFAGSIDVGGEGEVSFGDGDSLLHLYTCRLNVPMMLYSYENGTILDSEQIIIGPLVT